MTVEVTIEALALMARDAGLDLNNEELQKLLPGVNRARKQAAELREIVDAAAEPAMAFAADDAVEK